MFDLSATAIYIDGVSEDFTSMESFGEPSLSVDVRVGSFCKRFSLDWIL
jgi:hypothetical protein